MILRAACRSRITHHSSSRVNASSAPNGSSSISSCGSWISARQSEVRCCMPPDSSQGNLSPWPPSPTEASRFSARAAYSARRRRISLRCGSTISSGSSRFSSVVRQGSRVGAWNAMPAILTGWLTTWPATCDRALERKLQAGRELHQGGLAAAGRPDHGGELALLDRDRQPFDRGRVGGPAIGVAHPIERDERGHGSLLTIARRQFALRSAAGGRNEASNASVAVGLAFLNS